MPEDGEAFSSSFGSGGEGGGVIDATGQTGASKERASKSSVSFAIGGVAGGVGGKCDGRIKIFFHDEVDSWEGLGEVGVGGVGIGGWPSGRTGHTFGPSPSSSSCLLCGSSQESLK